MHTTEPVLAMLSSVKIEAQKSKNRALLNAVKIAEKTAAEPGCSTTLNCDSGSGRFRGVIVEWPDKVTFV